MVKKLNMSGTDEVGQLVSSFNTMSETIKEKRRRGKENRCCKR